MKKNVLKLDRDQMKNIIKESIMGMFADAADKKYDLDYEEEDEDDEMEPAGFEDKKPIKLSESGMRNMIKQCLLEMVSMEAKKKEESLCPYLQMAKSRYGEFVDQNLPDGLSISDLKSDDIKKMANNLRPDDKWWIKAQDAYIIIKPDSKVVLNAVIAAQKKNPNKRLRNLEMDAQTGDPVKFSSMRQVQDYVEDKYNRNLEFFTKTTKRGREWVYEARMTFVSASYADGPDEVPRELIDKISKWLAPFGFYYEGCKADHDERQWTNYGWHTWRREGKFGTYDPYQRYLARHMYDDEEW